MLEPQTVWFRSDALRCNLVFAVFIYKRRKTVKNSMWWKSLPVIGSSMINSALFAQELHRLSCILCSFQTWPPITTFCFSKTQVILEGKRTGNITVIKKNCRLHLWNPKYRTSKEAANNAKIAGLGEHI